MKKGKEKYRTGTFVRTEPKIGRNEICPCPNGQELELKYKHCCGNVLKQTPKFDPKKEYTDKMGEVGVFNQLVDGRTLSAVYTDGVKLFNKISKKVQRTHTIQSGMFNDVLSLVNITGLYNSALKEELKDKEQKLIIAENRILELKALYKMDDEADTTPEGQEQTPDAS